MKVILSHRCEHQFKLSFQDTLNPTCNYGEDIETSSHYLLHFPDHLQERMTLLKAVRRIDPNILDSNNAQWTKIILHGKENLDNMNNTNILDVTIEYLIETKAVLMRSFFMLSGCHVFNTDIAFKFLIFAFSFCFFFVLFFWWDNFLFPFYF